MRVIILTEGDGRLAAPGATVTLHYNGMLEDGTIFDSTYSHGQPLTFKIG